ncbi:hypothetical protein CLV31_11923 [Algoriphagus aquaeductus]|jgi:hypothetical protein|uniref:ABC transporter ATPase n=1 Tax=Algoriphagus aquaeductus TaxID=475299 RepID=A0A326RJK3_9BACT|nr:hypothetical protein [Algoriphagus aquaeductus]PZV77611.1 hypothetical protein CLV31_11923 [Algoriphagus aquaeductus]
MYIPFEQLPAHSRVWIYQAERILTEKEIEIVKQRLTRFCEGWNTHGNGMPTSFDIFEQQILVLAVDESGLGASGCSIDSSVKVLKELESMLGVNLTDQGKVSVRNSSGDLKVFPALGLKSKVQAGELTLEQEVINPLIRTKADLHQLWQPVRNSWLNKYFPN